MKVLFCAFGSTFKPHFEFELEILLDHLEKGDEVYMVQCLGELKHCWLNLSAKKGKCKYCVEKFNYAFEVLNLPGKIKVSLPKVDVPREAYDREFQNINELINYSYGGFKQLGSGVASIVIDATADHAPDTVENREMISDFIKSSFYAYRSLDTLVKEMKPDLAYVFNGRALNYRAALEVMQNNNVQFFTHERGNSFDKYLLFPNSICHSFALAKKRVLELWAEDNPDKEKIGREYFERRRAGKTTSWKSYTKSQTKNLLPKDFDSSKKNITIFNTSISEYVCIPDLGTTVYPSDNEGIECIARELANKPGYFLYLRVHPNLKDKKHNTQMREITALSKKNIPNFKVIMPWEPVDTYALINASDKVITFGSTVGIEATYWGRPSIQVGTAYHKHDLDVTYSPETHEEVVKLILTDNLPPKPQINAVKCGLMESYAGIKSKYYKPETSVTGTFKGRYLIPPHRILKRLEFLQRRIKFLIKGW